MTTFFVNSACKRLSLGNLNSEARVMMLVFLVNTRYIKPSQTVKGCVLLAVLLDWSASTKHEIKTIVWHSQAVTKN